MSPWSTAILGEWNVKFAKGKYGSPTLANFSQNHSSKAHTVLFIRHFIRFTDRITALICGLNHRQLRNSKQLAYFFPDSSSIFMSNAIGGFLNAFISSLNFKAIQGAYWRSTNRGEFRRSARPVTISFTWCSAVFLNDSRWMRKVFFQETPLKTRLKLTKSRVATGTSTWNFSKDHWTPYERHFSKATLMFEFDALATRFGISWRCTSISEAFGKAWEISNARSVLSPNEMFLFCSLLIYSLISIFKGVTDPLLCLPECNWFRAVDRRVHLVRTPETVRIENVAPRPRKRFFSFWGAKYRHSLACSVKNLGTP